MDTAPFMLLFLSIDVIGSTNYKNRHCESNEHQPWLGFFTNFYQEFPIKLDDACRQQDGTPTPEVWKTAGDELIFTAKINCHKETLQCLMAFKLAIETYTKEITAKELPLRFKGCAWIAGFPVINAEIRLSNSAVADYIGPLIDVGFRLTKFANDRKLVISVELALLIAQALSEGPWHYNPHVLFDEKHVLKGVFQDKPYPIIWIDMRNGQPTEDEDIGCRTIGALWPKLIQFCKNYIHGLSPSMVIPYFSQSDCTAFSTIPPAHQDILGKRRNKPSPEELLTLEDEEPAGNSQGALLPELTSPIIK